MASGKSSWRIRFIPEMPFLKPAYYCQLLFGLEKKDRPVQKEWPIFHCHAGPCTVVILGASLSNIPTTTSMPHCIQDSRYQVIFKFFRDQLIQGHKLWDWSLHRGASHVGNKYHDVIKEPLLWRFKVFKPCISPPGGPSLKTAADCLPCRPGRYHWHVCISSCWHRAGEQIYHAFIWACY